MLFILPIRDGNTVILRAAKKAVLLFILPIRDGNMNQMPDLSVSKAAFYTSYKGWKLHNDGIVLNVKCLFILPIRDGNSENVTHCNAT